MTVPVAIVHDYITQRGGAERVVLAMHAAFPDAPIYAALYNPDTSFPEFQDADVRTLSIDTFGLLRRHHRLALPLLPLSFSTHRVDADVVVCSSSGWAHGIATTGSKLVYCYSPARWLYQPDRYLRGSSEALRLGAAALRPPLRLWDSRAARSADRYLAISTDVRQRILAAYGIDSAVLPAPWTLEVDGPQRPLDSIEPGFVLCVSRLLPYKNIDAVIAASRRDPRRRYVIAGEGPLEDELRRHAGATVTLTGGVDDAELRWLYANCAMLVAAGHDDYGLTPLEAAAFGRPAAVLRWGGYVDVMVDAVTGVLFDRPDGECIAAALDRLEAMHLDPDVLREHAAQHSVEVFANRLRAEVAQLTPTDSAVPMTAASTVASPATHPRPAPRITVLVASYRRPTHLERCLAGVAEQVLRPDQVLVVARADDATTHPVVDSWEKRLPGLQTVICHQPGKIAALNAGLVAATGDIITFTDDDVVPRQDWLRRIADHFDSDPRIGAVGGRDIVHEGDDVIDMPLQRRVGLVQGFGRIVAYHHLGVGSARDVDWLKGANYAVRRAALGNYRFDERLRGGGATTNEDLLLCLALRRAGWRLVYDPRTVVDHFPAPQMDEAGRDQRDRFVPAALSDAAHNQGLAMLEHLSAPARAVFLVYAVVIGTRQHPGALQALRAAPAEGLAHGLMRYAASMRGLSAGLRTWRSTPPPVPPTRPPASPPTRPGSTPFWACGRTAATRK